jgi:localization factor PodJL
MDSVAQQNGQAATHLQNGTHGSGPQLGAALRTMKERVEALGDRAVVRKPSPAYDEPWDLESADALMRIYDAGAGAPAAADHEVLRYATTAAPAQSTLHQTAVDHTALDHTVLDHTRVAQLAHNQDWLDARLSDLAAQVERSIADANPAIAIADLGNRFADFETRLTGVLSNVATRSDLAALGAIEERVHGFAKELQDTTRHFARLDAIEAHLQDLSHIAAEANAAPQTPISQTPISVDGMHPAAQPAVDVQALFDGFAADRQRIDQQTTDALDTIQEALLRLIDRLDQIDSGAAPVHGELPGLAQPAQMSGHAYVGTHDTGLNHDVQRTSAPIHAAVTAHVDRHEEAAIKAPDAVASAGPAAATAAAAMEATAPAPSAPSEDALSMRKDFEAAALRARMKASFVAAPDAELQMPTLPHDASEPPTPRDGLSRRRVTRAGTGVSKRALTIAALGVASIGIGYVAVDFFTSPPAVLETKPEARVAAPAAAPVTPPAAPRSANVAPPAAQQPSRDAGLAPAFGDTASPAPATRTQAQRPQREAAPADLPPPTLPKPRSIPESGSDDLSLNGNGINPSRPRESNGIGAAAPGIAVDAPGVPRAEDIARMQQRRQMADASSRLGANIATGSITSARAGAADARVAPSAEAAAQYQSVAAQADSVDADPAPRAAATLPAAIGPQTLRTAAQKGDPSAEFEVAVRFAEGKGVKQDFNEAMIWYQRSATHGFAPAQYRLGTLYERGLATGIDVQRARVWYQRAAEQGNVKAMHNLAVLSAGRKSTAPDYEAAALWFTAAAERGLADSQFNLAVLIENGLGVAKDPREAYKWFALAARSGDKEAVRRRDVLGTKLDPADFKAVEDEVAAWRAKMVDAKVNDPRVAGDQWRMRQDAAMQ